MEGDEGAIANMMSQFHYTSSAEETVQAAMINGTVDIAINNEVFQDALLNAAHDGAVSHDDLFTAAYRHLKHRFRLGLFDPFAGQEYTSGAYNLTASVHSPAHAQLALESALQSMVNCCTPLTLDCPCAGNSGIPFADVECRPDRFFLPPSDQVLVQNPSALLPLAAAGSQKIAVVGPSANVTDVFLGDYRPAACPNVTGPAPASTQCLETLYQRLSGRLGERLSGYAAGCTDGPPCTMLDLDAVRTATSGADIIVAVVGTKATDNSAQGDTGREGMDRATIGMPGLQANLTSALLAMGKPVVFVVISGGGSSWRRGGKGLTSSWTCARLYCVSLLLNFSPS
jgi:beta-glucosidase